MDKQNYQPTEEEIKWRERLDELGMTAMCGTPMSDEEYEQRLQSVIDGSGLIKYLNKILKQKQEVLEKLADLEAIEQVLRDKISINKNNL